MWTLLLTSELKNLWRSKLSKIVCRPHKTSIGSDSDGTRGIVCRYSCDTKKPRHLSSSTLTNTLDLSNSLFHRKHGGILVRDRKLASTKVVSQNDGDVFSRRKTSWRSYVKDVHSHFERTHTDTAGCEKNKAVSNLSIFLMTVFGVVLFHVAKRTKESFCEEDVKEEGKEIDGEIKNYQNGLKIASSTNSSASRYDQRQHISLEEAIKQAKDLCQRVKDESGSPGLVMAVSVNGKIVMSDGFGFADVENRVPCTPDSVMRIASISKSLTMAAVAKAVENNILDLDKPVQEYVPQFPEKEVNGEKVTVTTRQLVSHLGGIRHYDKKYMQKDGTKNLEGKALKNDNEGPYPEVTEKSKVSRANPFKNLKLTKEFEQKEYFIRKHYASVEKSLDIFKNDPLVHKPGTKFLYTTHGWTLVAAVLEGATKQKFPDLMIKLFKDLGLENTYLEKNQPIIYNRARFYARSKKNQLVNAPYVECSHKYAGGGMMSTAPDLVRFGNAMLYSYQLPDTINLEQNRETERSGDADNIGESTSDRRLPGYLKKSTMQQIWSPVSLAKYKVVDDGFYAMGWAVVPEQQEVGSGRKGHFYVSHTGGAVGASSVLLIIPSTKNAELGEISCTPPQGVVVAMIVNMISVSLLGTALKIAKLFEEVSV